MSCFLCPHCREPTFTTIDLPSCACALQCAHKMKRNKQQLERTRVALENEAEILGEKSNGITQFTTEMPKTTGNRRSSDMNREKARHGQEIEREN